MSLRVSIVGLGKMGLSHLAIANGLNCFKVNAIVDKQKLTKHFISRYFNVCDQIEKLDLRNTDAVIISTPNFSHFALVKYFLKNDIHVFVEKPLTINHSQSEELKDLASQKNLTNQVGYVNRFNPIFIRAKNLLTQGVIGNVTSYENMMYGNVVSSGKSSSWRNDIGKGGGCLFDYGSHCIDLCVFFFGNIKTVYESKLGSIHSLSADDYVNSNFSHDNGVEGRLDVNWCKPAYRKAFNELIIKGDQGELRVNKQQIKITTKIDSPNLGIKPGINEIFVTDDIQNTEFYLRGEDFSEQLIEFGNSIKEAIPSNKAADFESSSHVDFIINQIRNRND